VQEIDVAEGGDLQSLGESSIVNGREDELQDPGEQIVVDVRAAEEGEVRSNRSGEMIDLALDPLLQTLDERVVVELIEQPPDRRLDCREAPMPDAALLLRP
jgi:hypothetical protein